MMKNYIFIFVEAVMLLGLQFSAKADGLTLTVTGGTGSGTYESGAIANIVADAPAPGDVFDRWIINGGAPVFGNIYNATTTLTMPSTAASVTALYMPEGPAYFDACDELVSTETPNGTFVKSGITLNTVDMLQGTGCIEYDQTVGTSVDFFKKSMTTPINTGATRENGIFRLRFWVEDPTKLGNNLSIELRSGPESTSEHQWNILKANLVAGWNNFNLPFSAAILVGTNLGADLSAINYFRIYSSGSVGVKARIDGMMVYDATVAKVDPEITWANPADVPVNTALSATQLNATANVPGTFTYTPGKDVVLSVIETKELAVTFKPLNLHAFIYNIVTKTASIKIVEATSVKNTNETAFKMYPNPLSENAVLNIVGDATGNSSIQITNLNGQIVYSRKLSANQTIQLNGILKSGLYMVSLVSYKSVVNQKLFVK